MGRAAGCPAKARWPCGCPTKEPAGRGGGAIGTPGRACGAAGRGAPGIELGTVAPKPVETGGTETVVVGAELGAGFTGNGWRGPESTCPGRGEPAAGIGRGGGATGRPGAAGKGVEAVRGAAGKDVETARGAPTGG